MITSPIQLLIVEDNPGDVRLLRECFGESRLQYEIHVVEDGEQAIDFIFRKGAHKKAPRPDLVLLDLNLPKLDGHTVLDRVKKDPKLKRIPIVVLTSSQNERDILKSHDLHANCYLVKPMLFDQYQSMVKSIEEFWFNMSELPNQSK